MNPITCEVVRDLLPLYADDAVSPDSRALVEEHLSGCDACRRELETCRTELRLPPETEVSLMKVLKARLLRKKVLLALAAVLCTVVFLGAACYCMLFYHIALPYTPDAVQIVGVEGDTVSFTSSGLTYIASFGEHEVETDGRLERILTVGFAYTPVNRLVDSRLSPSSAGEIQSVSFSDSSNPAPISRIYYQTPDTYLEFGRFQLWPVAHTDEPVLLWEAEGAPLSIPVEPVG